MPAGRRRGWPNCNLCQLCKREQQSAAHLFFKCRYSLNVWRMIRDWLGLVYIDLLHWSSFNSVEDWWCSVINIQGNRRKGMATLVMLVSWEIWNERNARVFRKIFSMPTVVTSKIKREAST
ncbi:hypothetical protein BRADI_3g48564v3 [Brachypodium distachyon]|uniref:Reverse transcriptase zinc-binding domain-containing protein n=1 Tax=Brachypodium distachyon TaxID=15368 RepID=A0A2K2D452_BRADI|nr:hypothetical protein BRADI_3g48564v3 [Brachypodium distachyon]